MLDQNVAVWSDLSRQDNSNPDRSQSLLLSATAVNLLKAWEKLTFKAVEKALDTMLDVLCRSQ